MACFSSVTGRGRRSRGCRCPRGRKGECCCLLLAVLWAISPLAAASSAGGCGLRAAGHAPWLDLSPARKQLLGDNWVMYLRTGEGCSLLLRSLKTRACSSLPAPSPPSSVGALAPSPACAAPAVPASMRAAEPQEHPSAVQPAADTIISPGGQDPSQDRRSPRQRERVYSFRRCHRQTMLSPVFVLQVPSLPPPPPPLPPRSPGRGRVRCPPSCETSSSTCSPTTPRRCVPAASPTAAGCRGRATISSAGWASVGDPAATRSGPCSTATRTSAATSAKSRWPAPHSAPPRLLR